MIAQEEMKYIMHIEAISLMNLTSHYTLYLSFPTHTFARPKRKVCRHVCVYVLYALYVCLHLPAEGGCQDAK